MRHKTQQETGCNFKTLLFLVDVVALILRATGLIRKYVFKITNLLSIAVSILTNLLNKPIFATVLGGQVRYLSPKHERRH